MSGGRNWTRWAGDMSRSRDDMRMSGSAAIPSFLLERLHPLATIAGEQSGLIEVVETAGKHPGVSAGSR